MSSVVDAAPGFDPATVVVTDDGTNTVLDFGFGTITLDGITGGAGTEFEFDRRHQHCRRL